MNYKNLDEYLDTLTDEEKELHKELIEECKQREEQVNESMKDRPTNLSDSVEELNAALSNLKDTVVKQAKNSIGTLRESALTLKLMLIKDEDFKH